MKKQLEAMNDHIDSVDAEMAANRAKIKPGEIEAVTLSPKAIKLGTHIIDHNFMVKKFQCGEYVDYGTLLSSIKHLNSWPPGLILVIPEMGAAYRREGITILSTPILANGHISLEYDDWNIVDQDRIDPEELKTLLNYLERIYERGTLPSV